MRVAFVNNQIDNRGTGNALYDYACYNEEFLGNESLIFTLSNTNIDPHMGTKLSNRFTNIYTAWDLVTRNMGIDVVYHIKSGENDGSLEVTGARYAVHAVFNGSQPHGDRYATISRWMGEKYNIPYVPHIVRLATPTYDIRQQYNIPKNAVVFGRHGGPDTFDISWAWEAIKEVTTEYDNVYFLFLNTTHPNSGLKLNEQVIFIPPTANDHYKSSFIHACDAMLHARQRGETFGIAVGEFSLAGKPVLTYGESGERAHIDELAGSQCYLYFNKNHLIDGIHYIRNGTWKPWSFGYQDFTPDKVMDKFKEVFLD